MNLFGDGVALWLGNVEDGDRGDAAMTAVGADADATVDTFFRER